MISEKEFMFWAVFYRLVNAQSLKNIYVSKSNFESRSSYILNDKIWLFVKTTNRLNSPWTFTFSKENQDEIQKLKDDYGSVFLILVCKNDWIVSLSYEELKHILDYDHEDGEWIRVIRKSGEKYTVYWHNWELSYKIWDNEFPKKIINIL